MRKSTTVITIIVFVLAFKPLVVAQTDFLVNEHNIEISSLDEKISVKETMSFRMDRNTTLKNLSFWIPDNAERVNIFIDNNEVTFVIKGNIYICDVKNLSLEGEKTQAVLNYEIETEKGRYNKTVTYNTSLLSVEFNGEKIFFSEKLERGTFFSLQLYAPYEQPLSLYIILLIFLLVVLLIVSTYYFIRKRKNAPRATDESEEFLNTKKKLLMSLLKDLEKQHRANSISDDTYHKIKEQYKNEALEAMSQLEKLKSKIK